MERVLLNVLRGLIRGGFTAFGVWTWTHNPDLTATAGIIVLMLTEEK